MLRTKSTIGVVLQKIKQLSCRHRVVVGTHQRIGFVSTTVPLQCYHHLSSRQIQTKTSSLSASYSVTTSSSTSTTANESTSDADISGVDSSFVSWKDVLNEQQQHQEQILRLPPPRRCLFSVPGCVQKMINKAQTLNPDSIVFDLEDGVPLSQKNIARQLVYDTLMNIDSTKNSTDNKRRSELCVRINSLGTGSLAIQDLETILQCHQLQTIVVPKVEHPSDVHFVSRMIDSISPNPNNVRILAAIESAIGVLNLQDIASSCSSNMNTSTNNNTSPSNSSNKLDGLIFASEDYCANIEAIRTVHGTELLYARSHLVTVAKACNLQAIDMVHINYRDIDALQNECIQGRELGFNGKQAIHPSQIETIHTTFCPSMKDIIFATECVKSFKGTPIDIKGVVVDMPVYKWAIKLLQRAESTGMDLPTITTEAVLPETV